MCSAFYRDMVSAITIKAVKPAAIPSQTMVSAFMANVRDLVFFKDRELRYVSVSLSLAQRFGCSIEDMLGKTIFDFFDETQALAIHEAQLKTMMTGEALIDHVETEVWPDGRVTWSLTSFMPLRDDNGTIVGIFGTEKDVTAAKIREKALDKANQELREMSRLAGMAEAATAVVHNVGNVLNGVNVSTQLLADGLRKLKVENLGKLCALLREHADDLPSFMAPQSQGRLVLPFLEALHAEFSANQTQMLKELISLEQCVGHIKEIISIQQSYATMKGLVEDIEVEGIVEDALKMSQSAFMRHGVQIRREFQPMPKIAAERGKVLQILHNLLRNAKYALDDGKASEKTITLRIEAGSTQMVRIIVKDNGVGIEPANITRIFAQGFTTRKGGHGFGLHSAANAAQAMHGSLTAHSEGLGTGASFILELPVSHSSDARESIERQYLAGASA
jgi:PAS domain S-box-containing protein